MDNKNSPPGAYQGDYETQAQIPMSKIIAFFYPKHKPVSQLRINRNIQWTLAVNLAAGQLVTGW